MEPAKEEAGASARSDRPVPRSSERHSLRQVPARTSPRRKAAHKAGHRSKLEEQLTNPVAAASWAAGKLETICSTL